MPRLLFRLAAVVPSFAPSRAVVPPPELAARQGAGCRRVRLYGGDDMAWIEDGKVYGTGEIIPGNPFGY